MESLRDRNKREKEARILAAARLLFAREGFERTTTRAIAEQAGVAAGTLFLYARSKEELVVLLWEAEIAAVVERAFATLPEEGPEGVPGGRLLAELTHLFGSFYAFYAEDLPLARIYLRQILLPDVDPVGPSSNVASSPPTTVTTAFLDRLGQRYAAAAERGEIRADFLPFLAASNAFGTYLMGLLALTSGRLSLSDAGGYLAAALSTQLQGLTPKEQP